MARTIRQIKDEMDAGLLAERPDLSVSKAAEWRLWRHVAAAAISAFEVILDLFRSEVDEKVSRIAPGTLAWWRDWCLRFQNGHKLEIDKKTAEYYYAAVDEEAQIIKVASVTEGRNSVVLKVAKLDGDNRVVPLDTEEYKNFSDFAEEINFAGLQVSVLSLPSDTIRYNIEVFYSPAYPAATVGQNVREALDLFRIPQGYDAKLYPRRLEESVLAAAGVVTTRLNSVEQKKATGEGFEQIDIVTVLWAGYFEYSEDSTLTLTSINSVTADESEG